MYPTGEQGSPSAWSSVARWPRGPSGPGSPFAPWRTGHTRQPLWSGQTGWPLRTTIALQRLLGLRRNINGLDRPVLDVLRCDHDGRRGTACGRYHGGNDCCDECVLQGLVPLFPRARATKCPMQLLQRCSIRRWPSIAQMGHFGIRDQSARPPAKTTAAVSIFLSRSSTPKTVLACPHPALIRRSRVAAGWRTGGLRVRYRTVTTQARASSAPWPRTPATSRCRPGGAAQLSSSGLV